MWSTSAASGADEVIPAAEGTPRYAVEDFNYPGADKIFEETGILLKRGDGHILLTDCTGAAGELQVLSRSNADPTCFLVTGKGGFLTLEMKAVYGIRGNDYDTQVDMTVDDEEKSFDIAKNAWTSVGETADPDKRDHLLVEIRSSK
ncbi:hypothetical protein OHT21_21640 [Streptomyces sp. NBC_00286]|nr:hypothetical protein [Streptomyces sp. NBC_00286]